MRNIDTCLAGEYICDACGKNNFFSWIMMSADDLSEEEMFDMNQKMLEVLHEEELPELEVFFTEPEEVKCGHCGKRYEVCNDPETPHEHKLPTTETFQAGEFKCLDCKEVNFFSLLVPEDGMIGDEEVQTLKERAGLPEGCTGGQIIIFPETVKCKKCGAEYSPVDDVSGQEGDEDE